MKDSVSCFSLQCFYLLLLVTGTYSQTSKCPDPEEITPCTCTEQIYYPYTEFDCSNVGNNDELASVFNGPLDNADFDVLNIQFNRNLKTLRAGDFGNVSFIEIKVMNGILETIEPLVFDGSYSTAKSIRFNNNNLVLFPFNEIPFFTVLETISFYYNDLSDFPVLISDTVTSLRIGINNISSLPADAFAGLPNLSYVSLFGNKISTILTGTLAGFPNLKYVDISSNTITTLPSGSIELHGNDTCLYINDNVIEDIKTNAFTGVTGQVGSGGNMLAVLPEDVWKSTFEANARVSFPSNPFVCGCDMAWLVLNPAFLTQIWGFTTCDDGTQFIDLDPALFEDC